MTHPQINLSIRPPEKRYAYPEGWLVLQSAPGPAWTQSAERVDLPALRRLYPIEHLDHLEAQIQRIRQALAQEERDAARRAEAMRRLAHRGVLYTPESSRMPARGAVLPEEELSHLGVANLAVDAHKAEVAAALAAAAPAEPPEVTLLRRVIDGMQKI